VQAVILAGGLGTRLGPMTKEVPKPMVRVAGAPYLEHQLRLLGQQSIRDVVVLVGHLAEQIETYFGDGRPWQLSLRYSREVTPQGTAGALRDARGLLDETFLLLYGDSYLPVDYRGVWQSLQSSSACGVAVVYDNREDTGVPGNIAVDPEGYVRRYDKARGHDPALPYTEAGVLAFHKRVLELVRATGACSLETEVFPQLVAQRQLKAFLTTERFYDIGTPERLREIESYLAR
jgi:NDP-sugar pyrophosphorylase family protein